MSNPIRCTHCDCAISAPASLAGRILSCPQCGNELTIPLLDDSPSEPAQEPARARKFKARRPKEPDREFRQDPDSGPDVDGEDGFDSIPSIPPAEEPEYLLARVLGLLGAVILFIGVFCPMVYFPVTDNWNYIRYGRGQGLALLIMVGATAVLCYFGKYLRGLWITGVMALALIAITNTHLLTRLSEGPPLLPPEPPTSAFANIQDDDWKSIHLQLGSLVLLAGAILIVAAATLMESKRRQDQERLVKHVGLAAVPVTLLVSGLLAWGVQNIVKGFKVSKEQRRAAVQEYRQRQADKEAQALQEQQDREATDKEAALLRAKMLAQQREEKRKASLAENTNQTMTPIKETADFPDESDHKDWPDALKYAVQQGDLQVRVGDLRLKGDQLQILVQVDYLAAKGALDFRGWGDGEGDRTPRLTNHLSEPLLFTRGEFRSKANLRAGQPITDILLFKADLDKEEWLRLELPAAGFQGTGMLRLHLSRTMILLKAGKAIGVKAVPGLLKMLASPSPNLRVLAIGVLGEMGVTAQEAAPDLAEALKDKEPGVRLAALNALPRLGPAAKKALLPVAKALGDPQERVAQAAARTLPLLGAWTKAELPDLKIAAKDAQAGVRMFAVRSLGELGKDAQEALPELTGALEDKDSTIRSTAAWALGELGPEGKPAVPGLVRAAKDKDKDVQLQALQSLVKIGQAPGVVGALIEALKDPDKEVGRMAAGSLKQLGKLGEADVPALVDVFRAGKREARFFALAALEKVGPDAKEAVPALAAGLEDADKEVRQGSATTLGKIGPKAWQAVPALAKALEDKETDVRKKAALALGEIGDNARATVPTLIRWMEEEKFRDTAITALVTMGKGAVPDLIETLNTSTKLQFRLDLIAVLAKMGQQAKSAVNDLNSIAAEDKFPGVRKAAKEAVEKIQK